MAPRLRSFRYLHIGLALLAVLACGVLATSDGGHPPAIILLPVVLVGWGLGHLFLWFIHWVVRRERVEMAGATRAPWPLPIVGLLVVCAGALFVLVNGLGWSLIMNDESISTRRLISMFVAIGVPAAMFVGVLFRKRWGQLLVGGVPALLCVLIIVRIAFVSIQVQRHRPEDWIFAALYVCVSGGLALYILLSPSANAFFGGEEKD